VVRSSGWQVLSLVYWYRSFSWLKVDCRRRLCVRRLVVWRGTRARRETGHTSSCRDSRRRPWRAARRVFQGISCQRCTWRHTSPSTPAGCNTTTYLKFCIQRRYQTNVQGSGHLRKTRGNEAMELFTPHKGRGVQLQPPTFSGHPRIRPPIGGVQAFASTRPRHRP